MSVYLANIGLLLIWAFFLLKIKPSEKKRIAFCAIACLQLVLISGLRDWSIGADTLTYYHTFENAKTTSWSTIWSNVVDYLFHGLEIKDPGYYLFQKIFQIFSDNYQVYLIVIAVIFMVSMTRWIYKNSAMPEISFIVYSVLFYSFYSVTGLRQTLATALIVFWGYEFVKDRKPIKFAIVAFIAFLIHKSSLVFVPYYFIANIAFSYIYVGILSVIAVVIALLGDQLYAPIAFFLGFHEEQIFYEGGGTEIFTFLMITVCLVSFALYPWISKRRNDTSNIYNLVYLTLISTLLVMQQQSFMRIQQYYSLIIMIIIPEMVQSIEKKYRDFVSIIGIIVMVAFLIQSNPQYRFFWQ